MVIFQTDGGSSESVPSGFGFLPCGRCLFSFSRVGGPNQTRQRKSLILQFWNRQWVAVALEEQDTKQEIFTTWNEATTTKRLFNEATSSSLCFCHKMVFQKRCAVCRFTHDTHCYQEIEYVWIQWIESEQQNGTYTDRPHLTRQEQNPGSWGNIVISMINENRADDIGFIHLNEDVILSFEWGCPDR